jgi:hypothetical protein
MSETIIKQSLEDNSGYLDAFAGIAKTYIGAKFSESSREKIIPTNYANGNTDTIYQPERGQTQAGETIVVNEPTKLNYKKIGVYSAIGFGGLLAAGVIYKVVK